MNSASASNFRREVNRQRRYFDPLPACPLNPDPDPARNLVNVTGITGTWSGTFGKKMHGQFGPLDAHRAAEFAVANLDALGALDGDEAHRRIVRHAVADLKRAGERGTAVHDLIECTVRGVTQLLPDPFAVPYADQIAELVEWLDLDPAGMLIEAVVMNWTEGYAGTLDLGAVSTALDAVTLFDHKSRSAGSKHTAYPKEVAQLGLLAACEYVIVAGPDGQPVRRELPAFELAAVNSVAPESFAVLPIPIDDAITVGRAVLASWRARDEGERLARKCVGPACPAPVPTVELIADAFPGTVVDEAETAKLLTERQVRALDLLRVERDRDRDRFAAQWRSVLADVPGPQAFTEWTHDHLDAIERAYGLPFTDPPVPTPPADATVAERVESPAPEDHGGEADPVAIADLLARLAAASEGVLAWQRLWRAEGDAAGLAWRMGRGPHISARAFDASLAGWWLAKLVEQADDPETGLDDARRVLATVLGDAAKMPTIAIGACLGALNRDQAAMAVTVAQAAYEGDVRLTADGLFEVAA